MRPLPELQTVMAEIPALADASLRQQLPGGLASESCLMEVRGRLLVVRIDTPLARKLDLDRHAELGVLEAVAAAGIGPDVVWADPVAGVLVTRYIPEPVWTEQDVQDPACLENLAGTLRRLHGVPAAGKDFNPARAARTYAAGLGTKAASNLAERAATLTRQLLAPGHPRALCHNDLVYMNIIGSNPVRLIDWEYAAMGDPLFDLAVVIRHHRLPTAIARAFLHHYMGELDAETSDRFNAFCQLYDLLSELWYMAVDSHPNPTQE